MVRGPFYALLGAWVLGLIFTTWWVFELWTGAGIFYVGPKAVLVVWSVPMLPLFGLTWHWLRRRQATPRLLVWIIGVGWTALLVAPNPPMPTFAFNNQIGYRTFVSPWFSVTLLSLTALPIVASFGMLATVLRAARLPVVKPPAA